MLGGSLVNYSSSDSDTDDLSNNLKKKTADDIIRNDTKKGKSSTIPIIASNDANFTCKTKNNLGSKVCLPSVPNSIIDLFPESPQNNLSSPEFHQGRIRSFAHEKGNWASLLYIPICDVEYFKTLSESICTKLNLHDHDKFKPVTDFHISLSRTFVIKYHWIEPLKESFTKHLCSHSRFNFSFSDLQVYANDEKTRSFIGLVVSLGHQAMQSLTSTIDSDLSEFDLPPYYCPPSFHLSLVWTLGNFTDSAVSSEILEGLKPIVEDVLESSLVDLDLLATRVVFKTGNRDYSFPLESKL